MSRRRQFGSVRRLPSGRWQARYQVLGGRSLTAPRTFATKAEAGRWLAAVEADQTRGLWVDPQAGTVLLADYARAWLRGHVRIAKRTREIYEAQLRLHILPAIATEVIALGDVAIADLTPELVRRWYGALSTQRGTSVAAKAYVRLRQILARAVEDERIARNPCRIQKGGAERHAEQRFATMLQLFDIAAAVPDGYRALVLTAGLTGLRQGELFALRWSDVDLAEGVVTVRRKRLRLASGEVIEDDPKSRAGLRKVTMPGMLVAELDRHLRVYGGGAGRDGYVFTSAAGEPIERSNFRQRVWMPATRSVGLDGLRFHDLRHTAGTLAARTGAATKELMARLGHASPRAALIYQHASDDRDRRIAERLDEMAVEAGLEPLVPSGPGDSPSRSGTDLARRANGEAPC